MSDRRIPLHEERQRTAQVNAKLRAMRATALLPCDVLYAAGELEAPGWGVLHTFRDDRVALLTARAKGRVRKPEPEDARPRKGLPMNLREIEHLIKASGKQGDTGYGMRQSELERALLCERKMSGDCFGWALLLIGEQPGHVEPEHARRTAWELAQIYDGREGTMRWKDGVAR